MNAGQIISKHRTYCWDCGTTLAVGATIVQGDDDHNYCPPCALADDVQPVRTYRSETLGRVTIPE